MNDAIKYLLALLILIGVGMGAWKLWEYWGSFKQPEAITSSSSSSSSSSPVVDGASLPGLPPRLEPYLQDAQRHGASGLRDFLARYGKVVSDPRLGSIELDYVVLVAKNDPIEARRV